jgi:hypothetical protein
MNLHLKIVERGEIEESWDVGGEGSPSVKSNEMPRWGEVAGRFRLGFHWKEMKKLRKRDGESLKVPNSKLPCEELRGR